jgi:protein-L-isoaspartate(D-aspartate) O-methyltransferase
MSLNLELARHNMVEQQVRTWDVLDARVLEALGAVPREDFVPAAHRSLAFADVELPLAHGERMMKPVVEGRVLQALALKADDSVFEIGTGSGFLTACLARLAREVLSVEQHADLAAAATQKLAQAGVQNARVEVGEAVLAFDPGRQFDAVVVTGAVFALPERFRRWLKPGGRLFVVEGESPVQRARLVTRQHDDRYTSEGLFETDLPYLTNAAPPRSFSL